MDTDFNEKSEQVRLAPFNPTCSHANQVALDLLSLDENDVLFDLGCGDARLLISAAAQTPGLRCIGIEIDPVYAARAVEALSAAPVDVSSRVDIREGDVIQHIHATAINVGTKETNCDCPYKDNLEKLSFATEATAVFLYLLPKGLKLIKPYLEATAQQRRKEGRAFRVASYMFRVPEWTPTGVDRTTKGDCPVYFYNLCNSIDK